jgi:hypothetical protein
MWDWTTRNHLRSVREGAIQVAILARVERGDARTRIADLTVATSRANLTGSAKARATGSAKARGTDSAKAHATDRTRPNHRIMHRASLSITSILSQRPVMVALVRSGASRRIVSTPAPIRIPSNATDVSVQRVGKIGADVLNLPRRRSVGSEGAVRSIPRTCSSIEKISIQIDHFNVKCGVGETSHLKKWRIP